MKYGKLCLAFVVLCGLTFLGKAVWADKPLTLEESIALALRRSVLLQAAKQGVRGAEANKKEAYTAFFPKLSTSYSYTRLDKTPTFNMPGSPALTLPTRPPGYFVDIPGSPPRTVTTGTQDNYNWSLEARQPLFAGGAIRANYEVSSIGAQIARLEEEVTRLNVILDVKVAYYSIFKAERILEVARQTKDQLLAHRNVARDYFEVGLIPKNDLLAAEVELANGEQLLVRATHALELARAQFNTLLRRDIDTPIQLADLPDQVRFTKSLEECMRIALHNRQELKIYELRARQANRMVSIAKSEYYPVVSLVGNYSRFGDDPTVSGSNYRDRESWQVTAVANWNFWEWGKSHYKVQQQKAKERQAQDLLTNLRDQIVLEVKNAYLKQQEAQKQIAVSHQAIKRAEENFRISKERYAEQVGTSTEVLDAQTMLTKVVSDYYHALGDYHISLARLIRAMGLEN